MLILLPELGAVIPAGEPGSRLSSIFSEVSMPDPDPQSPTPAQVLAGNPPPLADAPQNARPGQPPSLQGQPPAAPPPPPVTPQIARHAAIGQAASALFGQERDVNTGEQIKQKPGQIFRNLLAGFLLGGAMGSEGPATGGSVGGFLSGFARGGNAVAQQAYARQQQAQQAALERQRMSLDEQRAADEHMLHQATAAKITAETAALHHQQEFVTQDALDKKNAAADQYVKTLTDAGGTAAPIAINGKIPSNGIYSAPDLAAAFMKDPSILMGPKDTVRHFIDTHNASDLQYVDGKGWVNASGDPVDLSKSTTVRVIDVPESIYRTRVHPTGKEINAIAGYQLIPKDQEDQTFNAPLDAISGLYAQNLKNANESAQAKQRNAAANKAAATKRGTPAQFAAVEAKKAQALAKAEAQFEKDGDQAELAQAKANAQQSYENQIVALGGSVAPAGQAAPGTPKKGAVQVHAGYTYTFDGTQWVKGKRVQ